MTKMPLTVAGTDWTQYCAIYGYIETPRKVEGDNGGQAIDGTTIWDIRACKYDLIVPLIPLTMAQIHVLMTACQGGAVTVRYRSIQRNALVTRQMRPDLSAVSLALKSASKEYFDGLTITFTEA